MLVHKVFEPPTLQYLQYHYITKYKLGHKINSAISFSSTTYRMYMGGGGS